MKNKSQIKEYIEINILIELPVHENEGQGSKRKGVL